MVEIRRALQRCLIPMAFLLNNKRRRQPVKSLKKHLFLARGFMNESMVLYDLTLKNHSNYLSDYQILKTGAINQAAAYYLNNKVAFVDSLTGVIDMPKTLATITNGRIESRTKDFQDIEGLMNVLETNPDLKLVIKPIDGAEGRGVSILSWENGHIKRNGSHLSKKAFQEELAKLDDYFISEFVQQGQFAEALFPGSLNTIRVLTMIDPRTHQAFIGAAVFRVGTRLSAPTDNFRRYGLSFAIDLDTGQLGQGAMLPHRGSVRWFDSHPNTGKKVSGQIIPHWQDIQREIIAVADHMYHDYQVKYVGWDVIIRDDGISLLEGNSRPGVSLHQVHQPLLTKPQTRVFYQHHRILSTSSLDNDN